MARIKNIKGRKPTELSKQQKRRLSTKRDSFTTNLNQSAGPSGDVSQKRSEPVYLNRSSSESSSSSSSSPYSIHTARKSITKANRSFGSNHAARKSFGTHAARKSFGNAVDRFHARKRISLQQFTSKENASPGGSLRKSARQSAIYGDKIKKTSSADSNITASSSGKNVTDKIIKKARKSIHRLRPFAPTRVNHRRKPGVLALQQIRYYQKETGLLIPKLSFQRVVREILRDYTTIDYRVQRETLVALQEAAEMYLVRKFEDAQLCAVHANRVTLMIRDFTLLKMFDK